MTGVSMSFGRNGEIYGQNDPADHIYKIVSGAVRTYKIFSDGRRQIGAFYLAGDVFGLEMGVAHTFSAEAINGARVLVIKLSAVMELAERAHDVARRLWALTARELLRVQDHSLLLMKTAQERVASFLIEMVARLPAGSTVELPMSRRDIADYLGLTVETVCRALTQLENNRRDRAAQLAPDRIAQSGRSPAAQWLSRSRSVGQPEKNIAIEGNPRRCIVKYGSYAIRASNEHGMRSTRDPTCGEEQWVRFGMGCGWDRAGAHSGS
jgi:CRP/FNR family nitrogen fixation transcriptional regulator